MISLRNIPNEILFSLPSGPLAFYPIYEHGGIEIFLFHDKGKNQGIVYKRQGDQISGIYADTLCRFDKGKYFEIARNEGYKKPDIKVINPNLISEDELMKIEKKIEQTLILCNEGPLDQFGLDFEYPKR